MSENDKVVYEIDMNDPVCLAFMVSELIKMVVRAAETAKLISELQDPECIGAMAELSDTMHHGLKAGLAGLMQAVATEVTNTSDPELQEAVAAALAKGEVMAIMEAKQSAKILRPNFSFTAPASQVTN